MNDDVLKNIFNNEALHSFPNNRYYTQTVPKTNIVLIYASLLSCVQKHIVDALPWSDEDKEKKNLYYSKTRKSFNKSGRLKADLCFRETSSDVFLELYYK